MVHSNYRAIETPKSPYGSRNPSEVSGQAKAEIMASILESGVESEIYRILKENGIIDHIKSTQDTRIGHIIHSAEKLSSKGRIDTPTYNILIRGIIQYVQDLAKQKTGLLVEGKSDFENIHPTTAYQELTKHLEPKQE